MSTLYIQVPGTRGRMVTLATVRRAALGRKRSRDVVTYAKRLAVMAAGIDGHGYAEVWERTPRVCIFATGNKER